MRHKGWTRAVPGQLAPTDQPDPSAPQAPALPTVAYCSTAGAQGVSSTGVLYTCKTSATDTRLRWRQ